MARGRRSLAADIDEVRSRFEQWRQTRQGKTPIPGELWSAAIEVARRNGVNRTAALLHLDGGKLMRQMVAAGVIPKKPAPPAFIELVAPRNTTSTPAQPEYTIELEGHSGTLRIHCKGVTATQLAALSQALWSSI
jgi:hypothetical protein